MATSAPIITHPPKMPSLAGWWTCCGGEDNDCGREVKEELHGETCPECQHRKCNSCDPVKRPTPVPEERVHQYRLADGLHADIGTPGSGHYANLQQYAGTYHPDEYTRQPVSFSGWWYCCQCTTNVNPNVNDWTCPVCWHVYCDNCYVYP